MNSNNIKQVRDGFARLSKGTITEFPKEKTILVESDYLASDGSKIGFYAYMTNQSKKIFFTDAGRTWKRLNSSGQVIQEAVVEALIDSFKVKLLLDNTILENNDLPIHDRISNILQVQIAIDGMIRTWKAYADKLKAKRVNDDIISPEEN